MSTMSIEPGHSVYCVDDEADKKSSFLKIPKRARLLEDGRIPPEAWGSPYQIDQDMVNVFLTVPDPRRWPAAMMSLRWWLRDHLPAELWAVNEDEEERDDEDEEEQDDEDEEDDEKKQRIVTYAAYAVEAGFGSGLWGTGPLDTYEEALLEAAKHMYEESLDFGGDMTCEFLADGIPNFDWGNEENHMRADETYLEWYKRITDWDEDFLPDYDSGQELYLIEKTEGADENESIHHWDGTTICHPIRGLCTVWQPDPARIFWGSYQPESLYRRREGAEIVLDGRAEIQQASPNSMPYIAYTVDADTGTSLWCTEPLEDYEEALLKAAQYMYDQSLGCGGDWNNRLTRDTPNDHLLELYLVERVKDKDKDAVIHRWNGTTIVHPVRGLCTVWQPDPAWNLR